MELRTSWGAQVAPRSRHGGSEVGLGADCHEVASRAHRQDSWGLCPRGKHTGKWGEVWVPQVLWQDLRSLINLCCLCSLNCKKGVARALNISQGDRGDRWRLGVRGLGSWEEPYYYCVCPLFLVVRTLK